MGQRAVQGWAVASTLPRLWESDPWTDGALVWSSRDSATPAAARRLRVFTVVSRWLHAAFMALQHNGEDLHPEFPLPPRSQSTPPGGSNSLPGCACAVASRP